MPASWFLQLTSPAAGIPGDTDATHSGSLALNQSLVNAATLDEALARAVSGTITTDFANQTVDNPFSLDEGSAFRTAVDGNTVTLEFEDLVGMVGLTPDWDYDDRTWTLSFAELPTVRIVAVDAAMAVGDAPTSALVEFRRTGDLSEALVVHYQFDGAVVAGTDFKSFEPDGVTPFPLVPAAPEEQGPIEDKPPPVPPTGGPITGTITIPAGKSSVPIVLQALSASTIEELQEIAIAVLPSPAEPVPMYGVEESFAEAILELEIDGTVNEEEPPIGEPEPAVVSITAPDPVANESPTTTGLFRLTRTGGDLSEPLTVFVEIGGDATYEDDYTLNGVTIDNSVASVTFPADASFVDVLLTPEEDEITEDLEVANLELLASSKYTIAVSNSIASIAILDAIMVKIEITGESFIPLNANNDNGSAVTTFIPAKRDFSFTAATTFVDADLKRIDVAVTAPPGVPLNGQFLLTLDQGSGTQGGQVRLWSDRQKTAEYATGSTYTLATLPTSMYVEGLEPTAGVLTAAGAVIPDVGVGIAYLGANAANNRPVIGVGRKKLTVTPVIRTFDVLAGKLSIAKIFDKLTNLNYAQGIVTEGRGALPNGSNSTAGINTAVVIQKNNISGTGVFIQTAGYATKNAIVNGDGAALANGFTSVNAGVTTTKNAVFADPMTKVVQNINVVLDRGGKNNPGPTAPNYTPYYTSQTQVAGDTVVMTTHDSPRAGIVADANSYAFITKLTEIAVTYNMRLHLAWEYPASAASSKVIYPLAYSDWSVFFRASVVNGAGALSPNAAITIAASKIDHSTPATLVPPDFNDYIDAQ